MFELLQGDSFYGLPDLLLSVFMFIIYALQAWFWLTTSAGRASPRPCSTTSRQSASRSWRMTRRPGQRSWCRYTSSVSSPGQYHHHHHHHHHHYHDIHHRRSCYHKDREISKRINTAAKLRPKADGRIQQQTPEVGWESPLMICRS